MRRTGLMQPRLMQSERGRTSPSHTAGRKDAGLSQAHSLYGRVVTDREDLSFARIDIDSAGVVTAVEPMEPAETGEPAEPGEPADASSAGPDSVESGPRRVLIVPGLVDLHNHGGARGAFPTGTEKELSLIHI